MSGTAVSLEPGPIDYGVAAKESPAFRRGGTRIYTGELEEKASSCRGNGRRIRKVRAGQPYRMAQTKLSAARSALKEESLFAKGRRTIISSRAHSKPRDFNSSPATMAADRCNPQEVARRDFVMPVSYRIYVLDQGGRHFLRPPEVVDAPMTEKQSRRRHNWLPVST